MRKLPLLLGCLALAACDTGTPAYWGLTPQRVQVGEMTYDVRVNGLMAEALRQNMVFWVSDAEIAVTAAEAMRQASGCTVLELRGDPSVVEGRLDCAGQQAPKFQKTRAKVFICALERATVETPESLGDYQAFCV